MKRNRIKIVLADDNNDFVTILQEYFRFFDEFDIIGIAKNGYEAMDFIMNNEVDLLLLDIVMPKLDGIQVIQRIKMLDDTKIPRIIVLSAVSQASICKSAIDLGADYYIIKPYDLLMLQNIIRNMFSISSQNTITI